MGRKRKIFLTISLSLSLFFGKSRLGNFQSSSQHFGNQEVNERVINHPELNSLGKNSRKIILAKVEDNPISASSPTKSGPTGFPTPEGQPSSRTKITNHHVYRGQPKVVDQGVKIIYL